MLVEQILRLGIPFHSLDARNSPTYYTQCFHDLRRGANGGGAALGGFRKRARDGDLQWEIPWE